MPRFYIFRDLWEAEWLPWMRKYVLEKLVVDGGPEKLLECLRNEYALALAGEEAWRALRDHKLAIGIDSSYVASWTQPYGWDWGPRRWVTPMRKAIRVRLMELSLAPAATMPSSIPRFALPCPNSHSGFHMFDGFVDNDVAFRWLARVRNSRVESHVFFEPSCVRRATEETSGSKRARDDENCVSEVVGGQRFISSASSCRVRVQMDANFGSLVSARISAMLPDGVVFVGQEAPVNAICFDRSLEQFGMGGDEEGPLHFDVPKRSREKLAKIFIALEHGACIALRGRAMKMVRRIFIPIGAALVVSGDVAHAYSGSLDHRSTTATMLYVRASIDADVAKSADDASLERKKFFALDDAT